MRENALEAELKIDPNSLDDAIIKQSELFYMAAKESALAMSNRDMLKDQVKQLEAKLSLDYRNALSEGGKKPTEATISAYVDSDDSIKELKRKYVESCMEFELAVGLKESFNQRLWMLRELCAMQVSGISNNNAVFDNLKEKSIAATRKAIRNADKKAVDMPGINGG